ncbi:MAG: hypothetical protein M3Y23_02120, partial [Actinomycetota bacterium]|nr:hypothetical protein [Actinomycetota bacterium]
MATISVGALLATSQAASAEGATPITDEPHTTAPVPGPVGPTGGTGSTGSSGTSGSTGSTGTTGGSTPGKAKPGTKGSKGGQGKPGKNRPVKKPQSPDPTKVIVPDQPAPESAAPSTSKTPKITLPGGGLTGDSTPVLACDGTAGPPKNLIPIYIEASKAYGLGERGPQILASINKIETDFGRLNEVTSYAGAIGWMQFMP